ncbi:MAG: hypothetical protein DI536_35600 [Archangium gephyra]|uniref:TonB C-terminal domain-containing protein n=1 Tax=Archangium gephyra TaxID=48 RepID=A0A2W5U4P3_9BACT|nr:MAG: hypothetical protein DI536_35600 [Archangium gephyra]
MTRALVVGILLCGLTAFAQDGGSSDAGVVVPPSLLQASPAAFPTDAGTAPGEVELRLTVDTDGKVVDIVVVNSSADVFIGPAVTAARELKFAPATQGGEPIAVVMGYRYRFEAPRDYVDAGVIAAAMLKGQIFTKGTRDEVPHALISLEDGGVAQVEADEAGRFTLELPPGPQRIQVAASGHRTRVFKETLKVGQALEVVYRVDRTYSRPYETIVRGQADRAEVARITLAGPELREVAGTSGEPLRVIMLLPGVVTPISGLSYPVVRGAVPAATGLYLDGVRVPQLYHLMAGNSVVHPEFIESIDFYASNAPTRFGRISGGVISANVARARDDRIHATVEPSILSSSAFVEVPIKETGTNITVAGHVNYAAWLLGLFSAAGVFGPDVRPVLESYDYQARIEQKVGRGNVRLLAFGSSDLTGVRNSQPMQPSVFLTSRFHRIDLRGQYPIGPGVAEIGSYVGWETLGLYGEQDGERVGSFLLNRFIVTGRAQYRVNFGENFQGKIGFDVERQDSDVESTIGIGAGGSILRQPRVRGVFTGTFLELGYFSKSIDVVTGVRMDTWHLPTDFTLVSAEPRLDVRYRPMDRLTVRGGFALAHQAPMLLISLPISDVAALKDGLHQVGQFSVGAQGRLPFDLELSVDLFLNHIFQARERSLSEFVTGISSLDDRFSGNRWGRSYGLEFMLRLPAQGRLFGWVSYALMRSERVRRFALYNEDQTVVSEATAMVPFAFDQAHSLNIVAGYQLPKGFKVSASFHLNSGRPESGEFSSRTQRLVSDPSTGRQLWSMVPLNEVDRLPLFARLDVRGSKTITFTNWSAEIFLDIFNVLVRPEVYGFTYAYDQNMAPTKTQQGAPIILPTLGVKLVY